MSQLKAIRALRSAGRYDEAHTALVAAARAGLSALDAEAAGRMLAAMRGAGQAPAPALRVHVLGQVTTRWLASMLNAVCAGRGQPATVGDGGYDQVLQDLLALQPGQVDVVVLVPWTQRLAGEGAASGPERVAAELAFWAQAQARVAAIGARLVQVGLDLPSPGPLGAQLSGGGDGPLARVREVNAALRASLPTGAAFVDLEVVAGGMGRARFYDARRWYWTRQPFSDDGALELASAVQAAVRAVWSGPKKVLVLDLDHTLWGGVVGEVGALGVALGETPDGQAFRAFQSWCRELARRGVLLAVVSKNEPADARAPFLENPGMVLRLDDFAAFEAGWISKAGALRRIADQLRLGLDSFVFVDDNPAERELIRQQLPEVEVVDISDDPAGTIAALEAGRWFEAVGLTDDDRARAARYQAEAARRAEAPDPEGGLDAYLASLQMVGTLRPITAADVPRVVQLIGKTNQWNLTTRRHAEPVVQAVLAEPRAVARVLELADRFGDHGLVGVLLAVPDGDDALRIDTFLLSCRVIARTAEDFVFAGVLAEARALGYRRIVGEYLPTERNAQVAGFYAGLGLSPTADPTRWEGAVDALVPPRTFVGGA